MKVTGIAIRQRSRAPMQLLEAASITQTKGVQEDFRGRPGNRQVTLLSSEQWNKACKELEISLPWTFRRANILVEGIEFNHTLINKHIAIGEVVIQVMEETNPCPRMDQQHQGLTAALSPDWRGGVCCKVLSGGDIKLGDKLTLL